MLNIKYKRTTISLPEDLLFELKKKALLERKKIKDLVVEGLSLALKIKIPTSEKNKIASLYGAWSKGKKGTAFVNKIRNSKYDKTRDNYLKKLWRKS